MTWAGNDWQLFKYTGGLQHYAVSTWWPVCLILGRGAFWCGWYSRCWPRAGYSSCSMLRGGTHVDTHGSGVYVSWTASFHELRGCITCCAWSISLVSGSVARVVVPHPGARDCSYCGGRGRTPGLLNDCVMLKGSPYASCVCRKFHLEDDSVTMRALMIRSSQMACPRQMPVRPSSFLFKANEFR